MNFYALIRYAVVFVILINNSGTGFSQSVIQNEDDLVSTIAAVKLHGKPVAALLEEHKDLVTDKLWNKLIEAAITSSNNREFSRALFLLDAAKEVAEQLEDQKLVASVWYYIGKIHSDNGDYKIAIAAYLKSKQAYEAARANAEIVYILGELGTLYLFAADYEKAKEYSVQSLSLAGTLSETEWASVRLTHRGKAAALSNLGNISKQDGEYDRALDYLQQSLTVFKQLDADNSNQSFDHISPRRIDEGSASFKVEIAFALADIGRIYRVMGDHVQALYYFHQALTLAQSRNMKFVLAGVLSSMGMLYMEQGDYTKAIDLFDQSLKASAFDDDSLGLARVPINIGVVHQRQGDYEEAIKNFQLALTRAEAIGATEIIVAAQQGLGAVCQERGDYTSALKWLDKALLTAQRVGDKSRIAEVLWLKSEAHYLKGDLPEATKLAIRATDLAGQLRLPVISYLALTAKGKCYLAQRNTEMAFQTLSQAIAQAETLRFQIAGGEQERELSFENRIAPYNLMVELLISQNKLADAFLYAERAKGRVLLDVLSSGKFNVTKAMTAREREQEQSLNRAIVEINNQLRSESIKSAPDNGILGNLNARLNSSRVEYETFENVLYATHPELRVRRGQTPLPDLNSISDYVQKKDTAFLDYVVTGDKVFLFVLTKQKQSDKLNLKVYPINTQGGGLIQKANKLRQMIANRSPVFANLARELYDVLIKPAEQQLHGKQTLCIIPDDYLWDVPFQALQPNDDQYLLEDHAIYYAQSLSVLRNMAGQGNKSANNTAPSLIAFGNPKRDAARVSTHYLKRNVRW